MKLKKGSKEAKAFMAKIRAKKGTAKKVVKQSIKKPTTTKKVGSNLKFTPKENRLGATEKDYKTRSKSDLHKDNKSHNVNIKVVSGIGTVTQKLEKSLEWIKFYNEQLKWWKTYKPQNIYEKKGKTDSIKFYTKSLANEKKHLNSIKQTIK
jgi:hypothetical protein